MQEMKKDTFSLILRLLLLSIIPFILIFNFFHAFSVSLYWKELFLCNFFTARFFVGCAFVLTQWRLASCNECKYFEFVGVVAVSMLLLHIRQFEGNCSAEEGSVCLNTKNENIIYSTWLKRIESWDASTSASANSKQLSRTISSEL